MALIKVRDRYGNFYDIPSLRGQDGTCIYCGEVDENLIYTIQLPEGFVAKNGDLILADDGKIWKITDVINQTAEETGITLQGPPGIPGEKGDPGLVQLRDSSNIGDESPIKKNELVLEVNDDEEYTDILIGNDTDEPTILSELIQDRLYIPDREFLGTCQDLNEQLKTLYEEKYPDGSISYQDFLSTEDATNKFKESDLNFNENSALKKSGRYTGIMWPSLASVLGAPPVSQSTYFILETIRYSPEKGPDHWIVQIFTGINPPGFGEKSGKIIEFKRTLYTFREKPEEPLQSIWTDWAETIDRGSPIAKRFSLKHIGVPGAELNNLAKKYENKETGEKPSYEWLVENDTSAQEIISRCNFNRFTEAGRYCGLVSPAVASFIHAPLVTQPQYFILETKVYGDDNTEKNSTIHWIIQTFSGISTPESNEFTGEPFIYVRSMSTYNNKPTWTDWRRVLVKPFEEVVSITDTFTFSYYNNFCQRQNFSGTLSVIYNTERKLKINNSNNTHTIPKGSQGTLTIGNNKVSFLFVDPESKIHSGIATLTADKKIPNVEQGDVTWEIWDAVTCR